MPIVVKFIFDFFISNLDPITQFPILLPPSKNEGY